MLTTHQNPVASRGAKKKGRPAPAGAGGQPPPVQRAAHRKKRCFWNARPTTRLATIPPRISRRSRLPFAQPDEGGSQAHPQHEARGGPVEELPAVAAADAR